MQDTGFSEGLNELIHLKSLAEYQTFNNSFYWIDNSGIYQDRKCRTHHQIGGKIGVLLW